MHRLLLTFHTRLQIILVSDNNQLDQWKQQNSPLVILMRTILESAKLLTVNITSAFPIESMF